MKGDIMTKNKTMIKTLSAFAAIALCSSEIRATPTLDCSLLQNGQDITLNWSIASCDPLASTVIFIDGLFLDVYDGNFLGWWNATSGQFNGTVSQGWLDFPFDYEDNSMFYVPSPSSRFAGVFAEGNHIIWALYYVGEYPLIFTPDGPAGGPSPTAQLESKFTIASVPEGASTASLLGISVGLLGLAYRRHF